MASKMGGIRGGRRGVTSDDCPISIVQISGLPMMKMIKHCHEEGSGTVDMAQGALLGLVVDKRLEVTNCFPFPKHSDESIDEDEYQLSMMRKLRRVNLDHLHVGWYQGADVGNFMSQPLLESQFHYQNLIEESVVLIYDTQKTARGFLSIKAYRLTPQAIAMYKEEGFTPDALRNLKVGYETLFIEIPVVIKNSTLSNILLNQMSDMVQEEDGLGFLDLGTSSVLESHMRSTMERVDELNQEAIKFNRHQQQVLRQQQDKYRYMQKRAQENAARQAKDEPALPDEDINKLFRPIPVPHRLNPMMVAGQVNAYSSHVAQFCSQAMAKLFVTQSLQKAKEDTGTAKSAQ